jgi:2-haloacid dehalogenase/putative hydrolase of the HAD superfamily
MLPTPGAPVRALLLDCYGTLFHEPVDSVRRVCTGLLAAHALDHCTVDELYDAWSLRYLAAIRQPTTLSMRALARATLLEALRDCAIHDVDPDAHVAALLAYATNAPPFPDAVAVLPELARIPVPLCIVSNADTADVLACLARAPLPVRHVLTSEDARCYKPRTEIFHHALDLLGCRPEEVVHVGDSLHDDVGGAHAAGLRVAWVNRFGRTRPATEPTPDFEFADLHPLVDLVRRFATS